MQTKPTIALLAGLRRAFLDIRSTEDLCELLATDSLHLTTMALQPRYKVFRVPKKNGTFRLIEDPDDALQTVQDTLNDYLQAVYWQQRSPAAYGFLINPQGDDQPRHIETNAARHLGKSWLLNCDLLDFFHQVTRERVERLFRGAPFDFEEEMQLAEQLSQPAEEAGEADVAAQLFEFDPNTATQEELQQLGFRDRTAKSIVNYRSKGGQFRKKEDLKKIYTLAEEDYLRLEPYIRIASKNNYSDSDYAYDKKDPKTYTLVPYDPNTATH